MKRERESDAQDNNSITSADATAQYGIYSPGYSFVRPAPVQSKPIAKRPRVGEGNSTTGNVLVKSEPETERLRELSINTEPGEDLYGLEPRIGPSRRSSSNVRDIQTPTPNIPILPDVRAPLYNSHLPAVQTQPLVQRPCENNRPSTTENGSSEDGPQQMTPQPQDMNPHPQDMSPTDPPEPENDCKFKACLRLASFLEEPTLMHVLFEFSTEKHFAHHKKHHLPQITKEGFTHTCKTSIQINGTLNYKVTIRRLSSKAKRVRQKIREKRDNPQLENTFRM